MKNKFAMGLLSVVIAFAMWAYVITVENPESDNIYRNIPVVFTNEEALTQRGLMLTSESEPEVDLQLSGNRKWLNKLYPSDITITVDLAKIYGAGKHEMSYSITYPGDIPQGAFSEMWKDPSVIIVTVERQVTKMIPVQISYEGAVAEGYMADKENAVLDYQTVTVTGPASIMENVAKAVIRVNIEGVTETFSQAYNYTLCSEDGEPVDVTNPNLVSTDVEEIVLTLDIMSKKEVPLVMTVVDGGGATKETSTVTIEPASITVCGPKEVLDELNELVLGTIDLGALTQDMEPTVYGIPQIPGVTNLTGITEATVSITFPNLQTKMLTVTRIVPLNVPAGMEVEMVTKQLEITVRGPKTLVNNMTADHVTVNVDLSSAQLGTYTVKGSITMALSYQSVGALGSYNVTVTLIDPSVIAETTGES